MKSILPFIHHNKSLDRAVPGLALILVLFILIHSRNLTNRTSPICKKQSLSAQVADMTAINKKMKKENFQETQDKNETVI